MSNKSIESYHMDKMVIYLFLGVFLLAASVFGYRYHGYTPCEEVVFEIKIKDSKAGALVNFVDNTLGAKTWEWDFGDGSSASFKKKTLHVYKKPGEYKVSLLVNDNCEQSQVITIKEETKLIDSTLFPKFEIPKNITVGETLIVKDETKNASTWEWRFGETATVNAKTKSAEYVYEIPGLKTVSLIVNGDLSYITKKRINVLPKEEEAAPITPITEEPKDVSWGIPLKPKEIEIKEAPAGSNQEEDVSDEVPFVNESDFTQKIMLISQEKMSPKEFSQYFCGDVNKSMIVNGKNDTFLVFCEKIKGKKIKIRGLSLFRDKGSNCIKTLTVDYKKIGMSIIK